MSEEPRHPIGAIGAGRMGSNHLRAIAAAPRWELRYICDRQSDRLEQARSIAPGARLVRDHRAILDDPAVVAVSVNTLSDARPTLIRDAIAAGKHVLCEKPLAPTPDAARQLLEDIRQSDRLVTVNLINRNAPYMRELERFVRSGEIGELAIIRSNHCTPGRLDPQGRFGNTHRGVEGHILHDCGMHYVDLMRWLARSDYREFQARAAQFWEDDYECYFMASGSFENDVMFELHNGACYSTLARDRRINAHHECIGTHGVASVTHDATAVTVALNGATQSVHKTLPYGGKHLDIYYREFAEAVDRGDLGELPPAADAVIASELAQRMVELAMAGPVPNFGRRAELAAL